MQCLRNALADTRLSGSRRAYKQQDRAGLALFERHHRHLLHDPLLHLFQSVMLAVQDFLGFLQIHILRVHFFPGQAGNKVQIVIEQPVLVAVLPFLLHPVENLVGFLSRILVHPGILELLFKLPDIGDIFRMHLVELPLQEINLLLDGFFPIDLLMLLLLRRLRFLADPGHLDKFIDCFFDPFHTLGYRI